jgi:multicomponent K+:H+ antiporter subunit F
MSMFLDAVSWICLAALLASGLMCLYRLGIGPDTPDRAIAFDTLAMVFVAIICTLCIRWQSTLYFDAVWILTLVGFLGTASIARYLERGKLF